MKSIIALVFCVSAASAGVLIGTGSSAQYRSQDNAGNYAFGYNEDHATGGTFRRESGVPGAVSGSYGLRDADGRQRIVSYVADAGGYRANIQTNEPGVEPKDPADTLINKAAAIAVAAPIALAAPAPIAVAAPAAISYTSSVAHAAAAPVAWAAPAPARLLAAPAAPVLLAGPPSSWSINAPGIITTVNNGW